jgi:hypothetical protein
VGHTTDLFFDFKVIIVIPKEELDTKKLVTSTVNQLEAHAGVHILRVKPPKPFGNTQVFIIDLRVSLTEVENTEMIYRTIKEKVHKALGEFRDFDEGMRTMDTTKLKSVRQRLKNIPKGLIRELYYSIEDFFRVSASDHEVIAHIRITLSMLKLMDEKEKPVLVISRQIGAPGRLSTHLTTATLFCISYPHRLYLLQNILELLEPYEVNLSRLERSGRDILICRVTKNEKALSESDRKRLLACIKRMAKTEAGK